MATIGDIVVKLGLDRTGFSSGIKTATGSLKRFAGGAAKIAGVGMAALGAATVAATAVIVPNVARAMASIDNLAKTSDKLGIATENLAGLRHAAELTGAGAAVMDKGLEKMVKTVSEAAAGTGLGVKALDELGISAQALNQMSPDQQFNALANAINQVQNPADQLRLTMELFGRSGGALVNTLKGGSAAVAQMTGEANQLGLAISRTDAAKVEMANDAYTRLKGGIQGIWNALTVQLAPILEHVSNMFLTFMGSGTTASEGIRSGMRFLVKGIGIVGNIVNFVSATFGLFQSAATKAVAWVFTGISKLADGFAYLAGLVGMDLDTSFLTQMSDEMHRLADQDMKAAGENFKSALDGDFANNLMTQFDDINAKADKTAAEIAENAGKNINDMIDVDALMAQAVPPVVEAAVPEVATEAEAPKADLTNNAAVQKGSAEAFKLLFSSGAGKDQELQEAKTHTGLLAQVNEGIKKLGGNGQTTLVAANL